MFGEAALALRRHLVAAIQNVRDTLDEHLETVAKTVRRYSGLGLADRFSHPDGAGRDAHDGALGVRGGQRGQRQGAHRRARDAPRAQRGGETLDPGYSRFVNSIMTA